MGTCSKIRNLRDSLNYFRWIGVGRFMYNRNWKNTSNWPKDLLWISNSLLWLSSINMWIKSSATSRANSW